MRIAIMSLLLAAAFAGSGRAADLVVHQHVTTTGPHPGSHDTTEYVTATQRITDDATHRTIVDLEAKTFTTIDKAANTYSVTTFDELRQRMEDARKRLDAMPPEVRKMMGGMDADLTLEPTGKTEKIAGHDAKEYAVKGGTTTGSVWVTEEVVLPAKTEDWERFRSALGGAQVPGSKLGEAMAKLKGFPLRTRIIYALGPMSGGITTEVTSIAEQSPPSDVTAIPAGAKKVAPRALGE